MATAYTKLYELIYKNVKDEKKAEEIYRAVEEFIKENEVRIENKFKDEKIIIKNELKDELRGELATKEDIYILEEKMNTIEERIEKKIELIGRDLIIIRRDLIIIALIIILANYAPEILGKLMIFR